MAPTKKLTSLVFLILYGTVSCEGLRDITSDETIDPTEDISAVTSTTSTIEPTTQEKSSTTKEDTKSTTEGGFIPGSTVKSPDQKDIDKSIELNTQTDKENIALKDELFNQEQIHATTNIILGNNKEQTQSPTVMSKSPDIYFNTAGSNINTKSEEKSITTHKEKRAESEMKSATDLGTTTSLSSFKTHFVTRNTGVNSRNFGNGFAQGLSLALSKEAHLSSEKENYKNDKVTSAKGSHLVLSKEAPLSSEKENYKNVKVTSAKGSHLVLSKEAPLSSVKDNHKNEKESFKHLIKNYIGSTASLRNSIARRARNNVYRSIESKNVDANNGYKHTFVNSSTEAMSHDVIDPGNSTSYKENKTQDYIHSQHIPLFLISQLKDALAELSASSKLKCPVQNDTQLTANSSSSGKPLFSKDHELQPAETKIAGDINTTLTQPTQQLETSTTMEHKKTQSPMNKNSTMKPDVRNITTQNRTNALGHPTKPPKKDNESRFFNKSLKQTVLTFLGILGVISCGWYLLYSVM